MSIWLPARELTGGGSTTPESGLARPQPTLFIDRDGCLIRDRHYLADPEGVELFPGVAEALHRAAGAGYRLIGVSNQSGLGRGRFDLKQLDAVMARLHDLLAAEGGALDAMYYCPHALEDRCNCRKPAPGLLDEAASRYAWDAADSWVIGDKISDVELALGSGLGAVLVRTGYGADEEARLPTDREGAERVRVADDLPAAVALILAGAGA